MRNDVALFYSSVCGPVAGLASASDAGRTPDKNH
jgi:hypothetical protein